MTKLKKVISCLLVTALLLTSGATFNVDDVSAKSTVTNNISRNKGKESLILVKYKNSDKETEVIKGVKKNIKLGKLKTDRKFKRAKIDILSIGEDDNVDNVVKELKKSPYVEYAQPNYELSIFEDNVKDMSSNELLTISDVGESTGDQECIPGTAINILSAWELSKGSSNVTVAVIDTGIDTTHNDISKNIYINAGEIAGNGIDDDNNGFIDDVKGWDFANDDNSVYDTANETHGTMVSGLIAAKKDDTGIAGIAPDVKLLPIKFVNGSTGYTSDAIEAIEYAEQMGAKIVNCSWGSDTNNSALKDAMSKSGMLFVCAAGNSGTQACQYPAGFDLPNVIAVGASDTDGNIAAFSNNGDNVKIIAPGVNIISTIPQNRYGIGSGTSLSAPFVTGTAALLASYKIELTASQMKSSLLRNSYHDINSVNKYGLLDAGSTLFDKNQVQTADENTEDASENTEQVSDEQKDDTVNLLTTDNKERSEPFNAPFSYKVNNTESISANTGALNYESVDMSLPGRNGLDVNIVTRYSTSEANLEEPIWQVTGGCQDYIDGVPVGDPYSVSSNVREEATYNSVHNKLGAGWSFGFSSIEIEDNNKYIHLSNGEVYKLYYDYDTRRYYLLDYYLNDLILEKDYSFKIGQTTSSYALTHKDGKKEYFDSDGRLMGIQDRFENTIKFEYLGYAIAKIVDTVGREINIEYDNTDTGIKVVITAPDNSTVQYFVDYIPDNRDYINYNYLYHIFCDIHEIRYSTYDFILVKKIDQAGRETRYDYDINTEQFTFVCNYPKRGIPKACLKKITYPTGASSNYTYEKVWSNFGKDGSAEYHRIKYREETENSKSYNRQWYTYVGNYTGYGDWDKINHIPCSYTYTTEITDADNTKRRYTFDYYHMKIKEESFENGTILTNQTENTYYLNRLPLTTVNRIYNKSTGQFLQTVENCKYDAGRYGDLIGFYDSQNQRDSKNTPTDDVHKTTYVYDPVYHYVTEKIYKKDAETEIKLKNIPSNDNKTVSFSEVYENDILKSKTGYVYDAHGNVIEEQKYLDDMSSYISNKYSYADNDATRNGQLNGVHLTRKFVEGIKDADGNLINANSGNSAGVIDENYRYTLMSRQIKKTDGQGNTEVLRTFDNIGRTTCETYADNTSKTWLYNDQENSIVYTDEKGSKTKYYYDGFGNIISIKDLSGNQVLSTYEYDAEFQLKKETSNNNKTITSYTYKPDGRTAGKEVKDNTDTILYSETINYEDALNSGNGILLNKVTKNILGDSNSPSITAVEYTNKFGQVEKSGTLHNGTEYLNTFKYDYLGNKIEEKSARAYDENWSQPYTTKYDYNYQGKVVKQYNINGDYTTSTYDTLGRLKSVTDIKGNKAATPYSTTYEYDNLGRVIKETIPFDKTFKLYRVSPNPEVYPDGLPNKVFVNSVKKHYYDRNGNKIKEMSLSNKTGEAEKYNTTSYEYNNRNMLTKVITYDEGAAENYTQYYYDAVGNKVRMYTGLSAPLIITGLDNVKPTADAEYSVTKYAYDQLNRLKKLTDPMNMEENYTYDLNGNLLQKTDKNGSTISMTYDGMGRLLTNSVVNTENPSLDAAYSYTYTLTGNKKTMSGGGTNTTYYYDDLGRLINEVVSDGSQKEYTYDVANNRKSLKLSQNGVVKTNTTYNYDNLNRLSTVLDNGVLTATYTYDENGNRNTLTYSNGNVANYQYNLANKLTQLTNKKGTTVLSSYAYTYYLNGNQAAKTDNTGKVTTYTYDGLGRITSESPSGESEIKYTYDDSNNRQTMTVDGIITSYEYDKNNRLQTETKNATDQTTEITKYCYDNNGNTLYKALETISTTGAAITLEATSDVADDLTFNEYNGFNQLIKTETGSTTAEYTYNADGLRTSKTVGDVKTNQVWDGDQIALETDASGNVTNKYIRGINLLYAENVAGTKQYYLFNGHGDVVQLTGTDGIVTKNYDYDSFGNEKNSDASDTNVFRYCGEYFDKETGTIYLRARYYDPTIGRFITEDSYWGKDADPLSLNLYTYCMNNPIIYVDSSGNVPVETVVDIASIGWSFSDFIRNPSWANFGFLAWDVAATAIPYAPGSYTVKGLKAGTKILSKSDEFKKTGVWAMKAFDRGWEIEKALGGMCNNFPTIDKYFIKATQGNVNILSSVTSIKSIDITAKSYQGSGLKSLLKGYINELAGFSNANYSKARYVVSSDAEKILEIAIPPVEMTSKQAEIFKNMVDYAKENGIQIVTRIVK